MSKNKRSLETGVSIAMQAQRNKEYNDAVEKLLTRKNNNGSIYIPGEDTYYGSSLPEAIVDGNKTRITLKNKLFGDKSDNEIRRRLYDFVVPLGYALPIHKVNEAMNENYSDYDHNSDDPDKHFVLSKHRDDIWAEYLGIPQNERHPFAYSYNSKTKKDEKIPIDKISKSRYYPTIGNTRGNNWFTVPMTRQDSMDIYSAAKELPIGKNINSELLGRYFATHTIGHGKDETGEYASFYDLWDINPFSGRFDIRKDGDSDAETLEKAGIREGNGYDVTEGFGKPVPFYDRIYFDEVEPLFKGQNSNPRKRNGGKISLETIR